MPLELGRSYTLEEFIKESGFGDIENPDEKTKKLTEHLYELHNLLRQYLQANQPKEAKETLAILQENLNKLNELSPKLEQK